MPTRTVREGEICLGSGKCPSMRRRSSPADPEEITEAGTYNGVVHGVEQLTPEL
jgi:hypothetical protein